MKEGKEKARKDWGRWKDRVAKKKHKVDTVKDGRQRKSGTHKTEKRDGEGLEGWALRTLQGMWGIENNKEERDSLKRKRKQSWEREKSHLAIF